MAVTPPDAARDPAAPARRPARRALPFSAPPALRLVRAGEGAPAPRPARAAPPAARPRGLYAQGGKRLLDLVLALLALPAAAPLIVLLMAWVRLDPRSGRAPALYAQLRVGRGGRRFRCWKIRTMVPEAEAALEAHLARDPAAAAEWARRQKLAEDPRVIPAGRFLRASSLDELPQLWNVLTGEMSLVGPRPFMPCQRGLHPCPEAYEALRPGVTGIWQVGARGAGAEFASRGEADARYLRELSLGGDLAILARTARVVLEGRGS